jgi:hypothetical protein
MIKPQVLSPEEDVHVIATLFDAPLVTKGLSWLPLTQGITWAIMAREAGRLHPQRSWLQRLVVGGMTMAVILGSEWCRHPGFQAPQAFSSWCPGLVGRYCPAGGYRIVA